MSFLCTAHLHLFESRVRPLFPQEILPHVSCALEEMPANKQHLPQLTASATGPEEG